MSEYKIPLSTAPLRRFSILSGILIVIASSVITFFFNYVVSIAPNAQRFIVTTLWIGMGVIWLLSVLVTAKNQSSKSYILTDEALSIRKKGLFGKGSEQLYRYDTIISVTSSSRGHGAYGSIELALDQQAPVVLYGIVLPDEHARRIKKMIVK